MNLTDHIIKGLSDLDYNWELHTEGGTKAVKTKYGVYYMHTICEDTLFLALVHMRACMLNKELNNGR